MAAFIVETHRKLQFEYLEFQNSLEHENETSLSAG